MVLAARPALACQWQIDPMTSTTATELVGANHANWRNAPHNRWAFRHIAQVLPTATIHNDGMQHRPVPAALRGFDGFRLASAGGEALNLDAFLRQSHTDGFIVLADGKRVLEWVDEGMAPDTRHILMSATKSVTGLLCVSLRVLKHFHLHIRRRRLRTTFPNWRAAATRVPACAI